jgi:putative addiction module antidote
LLTNLGKVIMNVISLRGNKGEDMSTVKVTTVGNSTGIVLPKEVLEQLHIAKGDVLYVTATPGGIHLTPYRADFAAAMEAGTEVMRQYRNTLRKLAE